MKDIKYIKLMLVIFVGIFTFSCDNYLDEAPDNRAEIDNQTKIRKLLVSAYPYADYLTIAELSSDNIIDYKKSNPNTTRFLEELAYWKDVTAVDNSSPKQVWESCYSAIANANEALVTIERLGEENLLPEKGEALITRAFNHFILVNLFCKHYNTQTSNGDLGIPYMEVPETTLKPQYERGTVLEVYEKINRDVEEALPLISNDIYKVKAYHFTKEAAYAFAARFNLYYEKWQKAKDYATFALSNNPAGRLRDWSAMGELPVDQEARTNVYIKDQANLLAFTSTSRVGTFFGQYFYGARFNHTNYVARTETLFAPMPWADKVVTNADFRYEMYQLIAGDFNKTIFFKIPRLFQITDPVAKIGYEKTVIVPFTTDETLLVRAEARALLGDLSGALDDLNIWTKNFYRSKETTLEQINSFYNSLKYATAENISVKKKLNPKFQIASVEQENMLQYVLQCRRVLTLHEGLRWFDIKRYGIEIYRKQYQKESEESIIVVETLPVNDNRRAIQLPQEVISAGVQSNPR